MPQRASDLIAQAEQLYSETLTPQKTEEIRRLLEKGLAEALGLLANIIVCDYLNRWNNAGAKALDEAKNAVERALQLDPNVAIAYHAKGFIHRAKNELDAALREFEESLRLDPNFARARAQKANVHFYLGQFQEALGEIDVVIANSAGSPSLGMFQWIRGRTLFMLERYEEAIAALNQSIASWPELWYNRLYLVSTYAQLGKNEDARKALDEFDKRFRGYSIRRVEQNEKANPSDSPEVVRGRERFHEGLRDAGMAP